MVREHALRQWLQSLAGGIAEMDEASRVRWVSTLVPRAEDGGSKLDLTYLLKATGEGIGGRATTEEARKKT